MVPHVVRCCVEEVERRGMDEVGIYRISGTSSDISTLKAAFNNSKEADIRFFPLPCAAVMQQRHADRPEMPICTLKPLETTDVT